MGAPTTCEHCGKKFKVFAKRRKCMHCMATVCRVCIDAHVALRHEQVSSAPGAAQTQWDSWHGEEDVHFLSPMGASGSSSGDSVKKKSSGGSLVQSTQKKDTWDTSSTDLFDDADQDVVQVNDGDDDNDDDDDDNEEDLLLGPFSRRVSMEEEENQFREFAQIQHAVEKWTRKEMEVKQQQRRAKQSSIYATKPVPDFGSTRENQQRELFSVLYAVFVTLIVWTIYGVSMGIYVRIRSYGQTVSSLTY